MNIPKPKASMKMAYLAGLAVICIWGVTFVNTKILLNGGMSPADVLISRTAVAWLALLAILPRPLMAGTVRDELCMAGMGLLGGTVYFLTENMALAYSQASNVAFLTCTCPVMTAILEMLIKRRICATTIFWAGSVSALAGVAMIVFNGAADLHLNPLGDTLALCCSFSWAVYTQVLRAMLKRFPLLLLTRKVLFYTLVTITPVYLMQPHPFAPTSFTWEIAAHILFLGVVAQTGCLIFWNWAVSILGGVRTNNLIYISPMVTLTAGAIVLGERMTAGMLAGCAAILIGVWLCGRGYRSAE